MAAVVTLDGLKCQVWFAPLSLLLLSSIAAVSASAEAAKGHSTPRETLAEFNVTVTGAVRDAESGHLTRALEQAEQGLLMAETLAEKSLSTRDRLLKSQLTADAYYALGVVLLTQHIEAVNNARSPESLALSRAQAHLQKAVDFDPEHDRAYYRLGFTFLLQDELGDAVRSVARAVALKGVMEDRARTQLETLYDLSRKLSRDPDLSEKSLEQILSEERIYVQEEIGKSLKVLKNTPTPPVGSSRYSSLESSTVIGGGSERGGASDLAIRTLRGEMNVVEPPAVKPIDDLFRRRVRHKFGELRSHHESARRAQEAFLDARENPQGRQASRGLWKLAMRKVHDSAGQLHGILARAFPRMSRKAEFKHVIADEAVDKGFAKEMSFIGTEIREVERQIVDNVFLPSNTVDLSALQENMLIRLDRVQKMADHLLRKL